jgi:hypothetical protein
MAGCAFFIAYVCHIWRVVEEGRFGSGFASKANEQANEE